MEVDTESTNTSAEDKTEDFCENPTRDALTEGLMRLLKPTIDQLDEKIRTIRISQVEFRQQIESLSDELKKINEANSDKDIDLEVYIKKLVIVKQKLTVVSNILQNSEDRLLKLQQSIAKDTNSYKALLETSSTKEQTVIESDDSPIQRLNEMPKTAIATPQLSHVKKSDWDYVYEPAEDTFLLLDALEMDLDFIQSKKPALVVEVGSGSGIIITALSEVLDSSAHCLAIDINIHACKVTQSTSNCHNTNVDVVEADLLSCLKDFSVDMIVFNPPYVVTPSSEVNSSDLLTRSWAGGVEGTEVTNRFLTALGNKMAPRSFGYLVLLKENKCDKIIDKLGELDFECEIIHNRKLQGEELFVVKFLKIT